MALCKIIGDFICGLLLMCGRGLGNLFKISIGKGKDKPFILFLKFLMILKNIKIR